MIEPPHGQVIIYRDGALKLQVRLDARTVWLTQAGLAELFQTTPQNITIHIKSIYADGEQDETATCKDYLQVQMEGRRQVKRIEQHAPKEQNDTPPKRSSRRDKRKTIERDDA